jgi:pyrrolidone-carboxylate peptidase
MKSGAHKFVISKSFSRGKGLDFQKSCITYVCILILYNIRMYFNQRDKRRMEIKWLHNNYTNQVKTKQKSKQFQSQISK